MNSTEQSSGQQSPLSQPPSILPPETCQPINQTDGSQRTIESRLVLVSEALIDLHEQALDSILKVTEATAARLHALKDSTT